ncbi:N-alpha-acetyltransferase 25, NatB auxiliary subunit [Aplysia californica]|uniref:N-alpha-acetyltransferase 25, NatB auxiliary subunit n=1 Tax=Aplysia californica TaxID=6500 RepID=A0ABM1W3I0_APLCA|nr:N-alpha-acetyltransferase 25, NatB auxiliary subunit [Aplysia californica]
MASRSHVDVNERRLRPIYDCLDNGNNKKAIQEADKVLKKQKDLTCAKVLKALALLRMGRVSEGSSMLTAIHASEPTDEQTLSAMAICYKETQQYPLIASLYEAAARHQPANEDILSCLFMAHVRLGNYQQQQRTAMMLHKLRPAKNPYYFWAVMSIVMQAHKDRALGLSMYLPLAEKMTQKYIKEEKIEAEAEILLYLIILELEEKWEEALAVLEGPMGGQLGNELNLRETRLAAVCTKLLKWDTVNSIYKQLLDVTPDDWHFWLKYLDAGFEMVDSGFEPDQDTSEGGQRADHTVDLMREFVEGKIAGMEPAVLLRGPFLAQLQLLKLVTSRNLDVAPSVGSALQLLKEYFDKFGHKFCCFGDMTLFLDLLNSSETDELLSHIQGSVGLDESEGEDLLFAKDISQMTRHMVSVQLSRRAGKHHLMSSEARLALSQQLQLRYRQGLSFGRELLQTDLQYSDNYLLMAVHLLLDEWSLTGDDVYVWRAVVHLELGIRESPANFQFKLLLIRLYCIKGVFGPCPALYDAMEMKHIINDTMGYIVSNHVVRLGHMMEAGTMYSTMVRFFLVNQKEASEHLMSSYKFGSFGRIQEFVEFQDRLDRSLQFQSAHTEKMLLDLMLQTDCHEAVEAAADCIATQTKHIQCDEVVDNRDLAIALCWDPPSRLKPEQYREDSLAEEKCWLQLRQLELQLLLSAVAAGLEMSGAAGLNGNSSEGHGGGDGKEAPLDALNARVKELLDFAAKSQDFAEPRQYHVVQGPHRTRIANILTGPHLELLAALRDCVVYIHDLHQKDLESVGDKQETCWKAVTETARKLVVRNVDGLFKDMQGKRQLDSTALELLVASVESISYVTVMAGVCCRGLKPLKLAWNKKTKKGKGPSPPQPSTFENFNNMVAELSSITKELHQAASGLDPVFSSLDIASLRLADIPEQQALECEAERLVWSKVERSVQQSSREMCEVLHHKQFYLNTLML